MLRYTFRIFMSCLIYCIDPVTQFDEIFGHKGQSTQKTSMWKLTVKYNIFPALF